MTVSAEQPDNTTTISDGMSIGALREAIIEATELGGAWGGNMHESKPVMLRVNGQTFPLTTVSASFLSGRFVLVLDGAIGPERTV